MAWVILLAWVIWDIEKNDYSAEKRDFGAEFVNFNSCFKGCLLAEKTPHVVSVNQQPLKHVHIADNLDTKNPILNRFLNKFEIFTTVFFDVV